jgi:peptidoglycan-associated lipoprotein
MTKPSSFLRLAAVGLAMTAIAACTPRTPADTGAGNTAPPVNNNPQYPGTDTGNVGGGNLGAIASGDRIYFDLDSYEVRADAQPRLDAQAAWLQRYPQVTVRIEGNADERGTREYNLALGARRAESIRTYLVQRGVSAGRIDTISFGKERPIAEGSSEDSFARNRNGRTAVVSGAAR